MKKGRKIIMLIFIIILLVLLSTLLYSMTLGVKGLIIKEYKVINKKLPSTFYGLKVVHFSDLHYGRTIHEKELKVLVDTINITKPDIVVFTGDLVDKDSVLKYENIEIIEQNLSNINSTYGNYYVKGNHDDYFNNIDEIMLNSNFIDLNNNFDIITNKFNDQIFIGGIKTELNVIPQFDIINEHLDNNEYDYKILLLHMPDYIEYVNNNYNLMLAGHSHNGQIRLPLIGSLIKIDGALKYNEEHYEVENNDLFISSGVGTSTLNIRLFNKPSFNLYRIVNK